MRAVMLAGLLLWAGVAQAGDFWNSLWRTADQQGEQLMRQGKAAEAAHIFRDPRRKAFAELQAGDYQQAAKDFAAFDDSNGNYNRGNALARAGQLQEAIKAYDAALAHDPKDSDARYNRNLVARALQKQPPQSKPASGKDSKSGDNSNKDDSKKDAGKQGADGKNVPKPSDSGQQNQTGQDKANQNEASQSKDKSASAEQQPGRGQQQSAQANSGQSARADSQPKSGDEASQAKLDAAAALEKLPAGRKGAQVDAPVSEKQLAQEQWLRRIPDDPGGLLRRKFMIEHMIRQQGAKP